jgi:hypothetical protein
MSDKQTAAPGELYAGQFAELEPLPEWREVAHLPGVLRATYRGFELETRPSRADCGWAR